MNEKNSIDELVRKIKSKQSETETSIHQLLSENASETPEQPLTFGDRVADQMAQVAGSWGFIIGFAAVLILWIVCNVFLLIKPFDAYPFILLNLVLSCVAAIQAPIIMMSQNRQETKDRQRAECDYNVNVKSEIIIEDLHYKMDTLLKNQDEILKQLGDLKQANRDRLAD